jgi:hypothetical protein
MMIGKVRVSGLMVETHRDSYALLQLSVVGTRRPFLPSSVLLAGGGIAFGVSFGDLLYPGEIAGLVAGLAVTLLTGFSIGKIQLLSRDLRGSELSCMIWGTYGHLNRVRRDIADALQASGKAKG